MNDEVKILIVDDEEISTSILQYLLSPHYTIIIANSGKMAVEMARQYIPDLILLDVLMPDISGFDVFDELKKHESTENIPVIFITGLNSHEEEERGFFLGAIDYITKPFVNSLVMARIRTHVQIIKHIRTIEQSCLIDALTDLPNRRSFDERFALEWNRALRNNSSISLLFVDMDKFKYYNDTYGHPFGDVLIQKSGEIYRKTLKRNTDFVARWGGDEFVILLPDTNFEGACEVARQIIHNVSSEVVPCSNGDTVCMTISIGVNTAMPVKFNEPGAFIEHTDKALYTAKEAGRNRFSSYEDYLSLLKQKPEKDTQKDEKIKARKTPEPNTPVIAVNKSMAKSGSLINKCRDKNLFDIERAIAAIGGSVELYEKILLIAISSILQSIEQLDKSLIIDHDLRMFSIKIHGMKGSLRQIGYDELAILAEKLENAARAGDEKLCNKNYPLFRKNLRIFYDQIQGTDKAVEVSEIIIDNEDNEEGAVPADDREKILVVDDSITSLALINGLLSGIYNVFTVNSGESALDFLKNQIPDLILLDVEMPGMGGKEAYANIKADKRLSEVPIIFLTGHTDTENEAKAISMGISDYIRKPVNDVIMLHRVKTQLELHRLRIANKSIRVPM